MMELLSLLLGLVSNLFTIILGVFSWMKDKSKIPPGTKVVDLDKSINQRIQSLDDYWKGTVNQQDGPDGVPIEFHIRVRFYANSLPKLSGKFCYYWKDKETVLEAEGKAFDNRIIVLEFKDANKSVIRFGTFMFDFDHLGESLEGHFIAYAAERKAIVTGSAPTVRKVVHSV
jgi:hypothetical protein